MPTYTTPAQDAARIRSTLKKMGVGQKKVSVRSSSGSISIEIHDPTVDIKEVKNVSASSESIRYCEATGEILCGGNRFVFIPVFRFTNHYKGR